MFPSMNMTNDPNIGKGDVLLPVALCIVRCDIHTEPSYISSSATWSWQGGKRLQVAKPF